MYTIQCYDVTELAHICAVFVKKGLCFKADTNTLKIELTGGF